MTADHNQDPSNPMKGNIPLERQLYSLGFLCQKIQQLPDGVMAMAAAAGVEPSTWVDGVPFFSGPAVVTMQTHVARYRRECEAAGNN